MRGLKAPAASDGQIVLVCFCERDIGLFGVVFVLYSKTLGAVPLGPTRSSNPVIAVPFSPCARRTRHPHFGADESSLCR